MLLCLFDLFVPIKSFYDQEARLTVMSACMDRIETLFAEKELEDNGTQTPTDSNAPEIEYKDVTFAYDQKDVLKNVSFKVDKGTMTALVGPSGGGKSTIASLLTRFWDVKSGEIAEFGNHDSLMQKGGIYRSMVTKRAIGTGWKN